MRYYDVIFDRCADHKMLESTLGDGEGLYAHVTSKGFCHVIISATQRKLLDSEGIRYHDPSDVSATFARADGETPKHTFGRKVRDKKAIDAADTGTALGAAATNKEK